MLRRLILLLPGALLVQCVPAGSADAVQPAGAVVQKTTDPLISSRRELHAHMTGWIATAQTPVNFRLAPSLRSQWRDFIGEELWAEYARRCSARVMETGQVSLKLEYRDYVRLCAALRDAAFRTTLTAQEEAVLQQLEQRTRSLLRAGMSALDKVVVLHDALVQGSRYDARAGGNIADLLTKGCGSCEAYSAALCVMLEIAGVPSRVVTGTADGPHAWNLVQLGQEWYHVDATWDDPVVNDGSRQLLQHSYCCCTDAEMRRTHRWNRESYPASGTRTAYYYRARGLYFTSFSAYWKAALAAWQRGENCFEGYLTSYGSTQQFQKALERTPAAANAPTRLSWTGPETAAGTVTLTFEPD